MTRSARDATADTELLGDPYCRRFILSLWELAAARMKVTPTVADELIGNVRQSEGRHWESVLRYDLRHRNRRYDDATFARIIAATKQAAARWIEAELEPGGTGAIATRHPSLDQALEATEIAARIPRACFRRPDHPNQHADRRIIAEALVLGFTLLASRNLSTIRRERTNDWLSGQRLIDAPLILRVDDAVKDLHPRRHEQAALEAVLGAALPTEDQGIARDHRAIDEFLRHLTRTHATDCATWALDEWELLRTDEGLIDRARASLPQSTRAAELARVRLTRDAAEAAGYER